MDLLRDYCHGRGKSVMDFYDEASAATSTSTMTTSTFDTSTLALQRVHRDTL
jgi:hypothetical protein